MFCSEWPRFRGCAPSCPSFGGNRFLMSADLFCLLISLEMLVSLAWSRVSPASCVVQRTCHILVEDGKWIFLDFLFVLSGGTLVEFCRR